jgi:hypothetical protein
MKARDAAHTIEESSWSTVDSFVITEAPPAPELIPEPDVVSTDPVLVTLDWNSVTCPDGDPPEYYAEVDDDADFSSPYDQFGWISAITWDVTLDAGTKWYWRVMAWDSVHNEIVSAWSTPDSFVIMRSNPPPSPTLTPEPDKSELVPVSVTLEWGAVTDPDGEPVQYYVEVDNNSDFSSPEYATPTWISGTNWTTPIDTAATWYWRVKARDAVYTEAESSWSASDSFIMFGPPPAPTLVDEPDVGSNDPISVTLEWNAVTCPDGDAPEYYVVVDDNSDFSSLYDETPGWISTNTWDVTVDPFTTWYWRVMARDTVHTDLESPWSATGSFEVYREYIIKETFEGPGYEEAWTENIGTGCILNEDYSPIPGTPPVDFGSQCLQSVSNSTGYKARADLVYGTQQAKTFTTFYVYIGSEGLGLGDDKNIGGLIDGGGSSAVVFRLRKGTGGNLKFRFRLYNNGTSTNYNSSEISLNTWYKIETKYDDTNNTWEWKVNGVTQDSGTLTGVHRTGIQQWRIGLWQSSQLETGTVYFDRITVSTDAFD